MTALPPSFLVAFAALAGAIIGSFLNVVVHRVPVGASLLPSSACPSCEAAIKPWHNVPIVSWLALRGRCADCRTPISARYPLVEAGTAAAFGGVVWWMLTTADGPWRAELLVTLALLWFAAVTIALSLIDLAVFRLPDAIVLPSLGVVGALWLGAVASGAPVADLVRALAAMTALFAFYFLVMAIRPDGMGPGDVKLAALVGLVLGWFGWDALIVGAIAAFLLAGAFGLARIAVRRAGRRTALAFGPWMLLGAWIGLLAGPAVVETYLRVSGLA